MPRAQVTERTLYPAIIEVLNEMGGSGVSEVKYESQPDIVFDLLGYRWLLSVKIGDTQKIIKDAFVQYFRHRRESDILFGLILFFPESIRNTKPDEDSVREAVRGSPATCLVDAPSFQMQVVEAFPKTLKNIRDRIEKRQTLAYPLDLVVTMLRTHIEDMMSEIHLTESEILNVITDPKLFFGIGGIEHKNSKDVLRFLATYIGISQLLFLRLFSSTNKAIMKGFKTPSRFELRKVFGRILEINYRPVYDIDVLDLIPEKFMEDAFDLIWGLRIENLRYEIPGRLFHELMPPKIRKLLAAFYTRPQSAELLADLTIQRSDETILDPACGSGTILTAAYRRKSELYKAEGRSGGPHKQFCENDIFGADIMPFAVHLTTANLAAMEPGVTIDKAQIIEGDSLRLSPYQYAKPGQYQMTLFTDPMRARRMSGEGYTVKLTKVDTVLMNPPFTKVERGIGDFIDMTKFDNLCGGEIGLWGHFVALSDLFLKKGGTLGAVIPINFLRGRESQKIRKFIFSHWTPCYIVKPTFNYAFTEWAEYRDILLIAKHCKSDTFDVKFCLLKEDLSEISSEEAHRVSQQIQNSSKLRSKTIDIDTFSKAEIEERFENLMWFCGVSDLEYRDILVKFVESNRADVFPEGYFKEGFRPVPAGVSNFLFVTRPLNEARVEEAFLRLTSENRGLKAQTPMGMEYVLEKSDFLPSVRTVVGLKTMSLDGKTDLVARRRYKGFEHILSACGFDESRLPAGYWSRVESDLQRTKTHIVVAHRLNPFSPNTHLMSFLSSNPFYPSNQVNVIKEDDIRTAKAVCVMLNSAVFMANFFLLKEETTGRYINIRFYDLAQMRLFPGDKRLSTRLAAVYDRYCSAEFPSLREQLDVHFDESYQRYWAEQRKGQSSATITESEPHPLRLAFDKDFLKAAESESGEGELRQVYHVLANEMIRIRGLQKD